MKHEVIGFILLGDMNIHHQRWLFRSNANTLEGSTLKEICDDFALQEIVRQPTRGEYLLDLCLTDLEDSKCVTLPEIADHKALLFSVKLPMPKSLIIKREAWHFKGAAWHNLRCELRAWSWARLKHGSVAMAAKYFLDSVMNLCYVYIPRSTVEVRKSSHPWLNAACRDAVQQKALAAGTTSYTQKQTECAQVLKDAHHGYMQELN